MDAFSQLNLPLSLSVDDVALREAYRTASKEISDESDQAAVTAAYQLLRSPAARLRHWLELRGHAGESRGAIDGELVDWFGQIGAVIQETDALLRRRGSCQSALAKAMMEGDVQEGRMRIEVWQARLQDWMAEKMRLFPDIESGEVDAATAWVCVRDLGFIEKWQRQLRERYGKFF
jgi:hypothetical protein